MKTNTPERPWNATHSWQYKQTFASPLVSSVFALVFIFTRLNLKCDVDTHLSVSAFEDDSECAMSYQVLPAELKFPHRLHFVPKSDFVLLGRGQMTRGPQDNLLRIKRSFLLCQVGAAARMFPPSFTCHGLPSWQQTVVFSHVRTQMFWSWTPNTAVRWFPSLTSRPLWS